MRDVRRFSSTCTHPCVAFLKEFAKQRTLSQDDRDRAMNCIEKCRP
jgi:hypothetical protein